MNIWPRSEQCVEPTNDLKETTGEEVKEEDQSESLKELNENRLMEINLTLSSWT